MKKTISQQRFSAALALFPIVAGLLKKFTKFTSAYVWNFPDEKVKDLHEFTEEEIYHIGDYVKENITTPDASDIFMGLSAIQWLDIILSELYRRKFEKMYNLLIDKLSIDLFEPEISQDDCHKVILEVGPQLSELISLIDNTSDGSFSVEGLNNVVSARVEIGPVMDNVKAIFADNPPIKIAKDVPLKKRTLDSLGKEELEAFMKDHETLTNAARIIDDLTIESAMEICEELSRKYNLETDMTVITESTLPSRNSASRSDDHEEECDCGLYGVNTVNEFLEKRFPEGSRAQKGQVLIKRAIESGAEVKMGLDGLLIKKDTVNQELAADIANFLRRTDN